MREIKEFLTQMKKSVTAGVLYVNGSPFVGKRKLSIVSRGRMIEIIDFFTQIKKTITEFQM